MSDQVAQLRFEQAVAPIERSDHRIQKRLGLEHVQIERMSSVIRHHRKERHLRAAIAFAKGMDCVQFSKEMCAIGGKFVGREAAQLVMFGEPGEQGIYLRRDVLGIAEHTRILGDANGAEAARPSVDILEKMAVNRTNVRGCKTPRRQCLHTTLRNGIGFEGIKRGLVREAEAVLENGRTRIAIWVRYCLVHAGDQPFLCLATIVLRRSAAVSPSLSNCLNMARDEADCWMPSTALSFAMPDKPSVNLLDEALPTARLEI